MLRTYCWFSFFIRGDLKNGRGKKCDFHSKKKTGVPRVWTWDIYDGRKEGLVGGKDFLKRSDFCRGHIKAAGKRTNRGGESSYIGKGRPDRPELASQKKSGEKGKPILEKEKKGPSQYLRQLNSRIAEGKGYCVEGKERVSPQKEEEKQ